MCLSLDKSCPNPTQNTWFQRVVLCTATSSAWDPPRLYILLVALDFSCAGGCKAAARFLALVCFSLLADEVFLYCLLCVCVLHKKSFHTWYDYSSLLLLKFWSFTFPVQTDFLPSLHVWCGDVQFILSFQ